MIGSLHIEGLKMTVKNTFINADLEVMPPEELPQLCHRRGKSDAAVYFALDSGSCAATPQVLDAEIAEQLTVVAACENTRAKFQSTMPESSLIIKNTFIEIDEEDEEDFAMRLQQRRGIKTYPHDMKVCSEPAPEESPEIAPTLETSPGTPEFTQLLASTPEPDFEPSPDLQRIHRAAQSCGLQVSNDTEAFNPIIEWATASNSDALELQSTDVNHVQIPSQETDAWHAYDNLDLISHSPLAQHSLCFDESPLCTFHMGDNDQSSPSHRSMWMPRGFESQHLEKHIAPQHAAFVNALPSRSVSNQIQQPNLNSVHATSPLWWPANNSDQQGHALTACTPPGAQASQSALELKLLKELMHEDRLPTPVVPPPLYDAPGPQELRMLPLRGVQRRSIKDCRLSGDFTDQPTPIVRRTSDSPAWRPCDFSMSESRSQLNLTHGQASPQNSSTIWSSPVVDEEDLHSELHLQFLSTEPCSKPACVPGNTGNTMRNTEEAGKATIDTLLGISRKTSGTLPSPDAAQQHTRDWDLSHGTPTGCETAQCFTSAEKVNEPQQKEMAASPWTAWTGTAALHAASSSCADDTAKRQQQPRRRKGASSNPPEEEAPSPTLGGQPPPTANSPASASAMPEAPLPVQSVTDAVLTPAPVTGNRGKNCNRRRERLWCHVYIAPRMNEEGFDLVKKLIGRNGCNTKTIFEDTGTKVRVRGEGSGHTEYRNNGREAQVPLMIALSAEHGRHDDFKRAFERVTELLSGVSKRFQDFCLRGKHRRAARGDGGPDFWVGESTESSLECLGDALEGVIIGFQQ